MNIKKDDQQKVKLTDEQRNQLSGAVSSQMSNIPGKCRGEYSDGENCHIKHDSCVPNNEFICEGGWDDDFECEDEFDCRQFKCIDSFDDEDCESKFVCGEGDKFVCPGEFDRFECQKNAKFSVVGDGQVAVSDNDDVSVSHKPDIATTKKKADGK